MTVFFSIVVYWVFLQWKQTEFNNLVNKFWVRKIRSRLSSDVYIDPTLGALFWTNKCRALIQQTSVQHTTTCLPTCWAGKRQMRKIICWLNIEVLYLSNKSALVYLVLCLSNIVEFSGTFFHVVVFFIYMQHKFIHVKCYKNKWICDKNK